MAPWAVLLVCAVSFVRPIRAAVVEADSASTDGGGGDVGAHLVRRQKMAVAKLQTRDATTADMLGGAWSPTRAMRDNGTFSKDTGDNAAHQDEFVSLAGTFPHDRHRGSMLQTQTDVKWEPVMRGYGNGELHKDLGQMLETDNYPAAVLGVLRQADPDDSQKCGCALDQWDQYSVCYGAYLGASGAWSFGINGYDPWGEHVLYWARTIPKTYDCFLNVEPDFWNEFSPVCLGTKHETRNGRKYTNLQTLLSNVPEASALVKMDVEMQEWSILHSLGAEDFRRIRSLNVEYHFNYHCPTAREVKMAQRVLAHVREHLVVVDSAAAYYGQDCLVDGVSFPKILAVSYSAPSACFLADGVPTFVGLVLAGCLVFAFVVGTLPTLLDWWRNPPELKLQMPSLDRLVGFGWRSWFILPFKYVFTTSDKAADGKKASGKGVNFDNGGPYQHTNRSKLRTGVSHK